MNETEWLSSVELTPLLEYLCGKVSDRKLMLFSMACVRRVWHLVTDNRSRRYVEVTERFVDSMARPDEERDADESFCAAYEAGELRDNAGGWTHDAVECVAHSGTGAALQAASNAAMAIGYEAARSVRLDEASLGWSDARTDAWTSAEAAEREWQVAQLRDIIGNPFRPIHICGAALTPTMVQIAQSIYEEKAFDRMPLLADALEASGSMDVQVLAHCRDPGVHARGCWLIDRILGKQ